MSQFVDSTPISDGNNVNRDMMKLRASPVRDNGKIDSCFSPAHNNTHDHSFFSDENVLRSQFFNRTLDNSIDQASSLFSVDLSTPIPCNTPKANASHLAFSEDNTSSSPEISLPTSTDNIESDEDRIRREEEESLRMVIAMMEEETRELEEQQRIFMMDHAADITPEDLAAIREIVGVSHPVATSAINRLEDEESEEESESENWDYDQLLALGQALGDVKTERWQLRALKVIESLPTHLFKEAKDMDMKHEHRCVVCLDPYEDEQSLKVLPCKHYFHDVCASGWLAGHNCCPICKSEFALYSPSKADATTSNV